MNMSPRLHRRTSISVLKWEPFAYATLEICAMKAWEMVWEEQKGRRIRRAFTSDYESSVQVEYAKDGKAHCYLYIAVQ